MAPIQLTLNLPPATSSTAQGDLSSASGIAWGVAFGGIFWAVLLYVLLVI